MARIVEQIVEGYFHLLKFIITLCLALMVVLVFGNVVMRYAFNTGITVSEELSRWLFVYLIFLGAIVVLRQHGHLGVDLVVRLLPAVGKKICLAATQLLMLYATWLFLEGSWQQTLINMGVTSPASGLSMGIFYGVGIIFSVSTGLIILYELYLTVSGKRDESELVLIKESDEIAELEELNKELDEVGSDHRPIPGPTKHH